MNDEDAARVTRSGWLWIVPVALIVMILNVALHVFYMVVYSYAIHPGENEAYYQKHAELTAPYSSVVAGMPLMFLGGRWVAQKFTVARSVMAALLVWAVYFLIDLSVIVAVGALRQVALLFAISMASKFAAAYLGGLSARRRFGT